MKFETISGTKYEVYESDNGIFLKRNANHPIRNIRFKKIKSTSDVVYHLKRKPKVVVGKGVIVELEDKNTGISAFETTEVIAVSL